jgi:hypothetical protein
MLSTFYSGKLALFVVFSLVWVVLVGSSTTAKAKRGEVPQCQEECLATHSAKMKALAEEYAKTGNKMNYQDLVEEEASRYGKCLTNCRELMQVK